MSNRSSIYTHQRKKRTSRMNKTFINGKSMIIAMTTTMITVKMMK